MPSWGFSLGRNARSWRSLRLQARAPLSGCIDGSEDPSASPFAEGIVLARRSHPRPSIPSSPGFESLSSTRSIEEASGGRRGASFDCGCWCRRLLDNRLATVQTKINRGLGDEIYRWLIARYQVGVHE